MRPRRGRRSKLPFWQGCSFLVNALFLCLPIAAHIQSQTNILSDSKLERAQADVERIRTLVAEGTLPPSRLHDAEERLADVQDDQILAQTLYSSTRIEDMTDAQSVSMEEAAQRRVSRQQTILEHKQQLLTAGILSRSELAADEEELHSRERVLQLADNRRHLIAELRAMALTEQRLQDAARNRGAPANAMIRFDGKGSFHEADLSGLARQFTRQFGTDLPVSAVGQTAVHDGLGLDHRGRVDIALNPDSAQGLWLRHLLEQRQIPYLAFRSAVVGAATGPHIHVGPESTRLIPVVTVRPHN